MKRNLTLVLILLTYTFVQSQNIINLSNSQWKLWLDEKATWQNDQLFLPPADLRIIPTNPPTCNWEGLDDGRGKNISIPATVEEHFWGNNGNTHGISSNYVGVSWFWTTFRIPADWKGKRIVINFESCRLRAEIYVNQKLAGYDLITGTPFNVDISNIAEIGKNNTLAVRITDPNGNFNLNNFEPFSWGKYTIPPSLGFGGITGMVTLSCTDQSYISDIFIKNKPSITSVEIETNIESIDEKPLNGKILYTISEAQTPDNAVLKQVIDVSNQKPGFTIKANISIKSGKTWTLQEPNLYQLKAEWQGVDGSKHILFKRFGLRWFEVKDVAGDKMFFLNKQRIVLRSSITRGSWPINGIYPTDELAKKQIQTAKSIGLNMLSFQQSIGQTIVLNYADELGLLYYEEPGGYKAGTDSFSKAFNSEKYLRMIKRDRNHPSLIIYNMTSGADRNPFDNELIDLANAHKLDETRIKTFTSTSISKDFYNGTNPTTAAPFKTHMLPYDQKMYDFGWWDQHHAEGPGSYNDNCYIGPDNIYRHINNPKEIVFLGEEGGIGIPPRHHLLKDQFNSEGNLGWDGEAFLKQGEAFEKFLTEKGFRKAFTSMESFTTNMSKVAFYYQGRTIENFRIGNTGDGYVINGWEDSKVGNHWGIVDIFRNPKAYASALAYYNQPLYLPVKVRNKVLENGSSTMVDVYIINERDLKGSHSLYVKAEDSYGTFWEKTYEIKISGGNTFGELLVRDIAIKPEKSGTVKVSAQLLTGSMIVTSGYDEIYCVDLSYYESSQTIAVWDTTGTIQKLLDKTGKFNIKEYQKGIPVEKCLIVGPCIQPGFAIDTQKDPIIDWVMQGNTLIVVKGADVWAEYLSKKEIADYKGRMNIGKSSFGGNYFVREHDLFDGLPMNTSFNWEYQSLAQYDNRERFGLRLANDECIVGVTADHKQEVYSAVSIINVGKGHIILSTLDLNAAILSDTPSSVVAKRILMNYIIYGQNN